MAAGVAFAVASATGRATPQPSLPTALSLRLQLQAPACRGSHQSLAVPCAVLAGLELNRRRRRTHQHSRLQSGRPARAAAKVAMWSAGVSASDGKSTGEVYIGVDFGTSGCRSACLDSGGRLVSEASAKYGKDAGPEEWRNALAEVVRAIPQRELAAAICMNGTSSTALLCSDPDGGVLAGPLMYNYVCNEAAVKRCRAMVPSPAHAAAAPTSTLSKACQWILDGSAGPGTRLAHQCDWLTSLLLDEKSPRVTDYHNALKLGYDLEALAWPDWLLADDRVAALLPSRVAVPGETIGHVSAEASAWLGLPESCRVAAGTTDSIAAFLAADTANIGEAVTSLGSTMAIKMRSLVKVEDAAFGVYSHRLGGEPLQWLVGGASNSGGAVLRQLFDDESVARLTEQIDPEVDSGLDYYPLPSVGERFPVCDASLQPRLEPRPTDDAEFLHGVLEGLSRIEAAGYQRLDKLGAGKVTRVLTAGGGAKNAKWRRIRERLIGVPVAAARWTEAACGSALLAMRGTSLLG
ncbi:unnamed protein product [Polarella glacialis]|uniref:D-ribulose kinase n=1 Tax=Polarella glacialis TaxID=89957 RepID=A0A813GMF8_POLGL|nr:unnamed protein product [Polarella glacialis]CAE8625284.1 unnamed protein product [Polarella glacialis]CAE8720148.1 unnamed protein product [Polarella glacialis]